VEGASGFRWHRSERFEVSGGEPAAVEPGADWPQYHGDERHSGVAASTLDPTDLGLAWTFRTAGAILTGSPVVADGVAYVGTRDENGLKESAVHAVDVKTGRLLWDFRADASVHGTPAVADGIVYAGTIHATLYALDADSGRLLWKREAERPAAPLNRRAYSYYAPTVAAGKVFWPYQTGHGKASSGLLAALDPKTGAPIWEAPMTGATMSDGTAAVADGIVYVGNETADRIIASDVNTGTRLWTSTARLGDWQDAAPVVDGGRCSSAPTTASSRATRRPAPTCGRTRVPTRRGSPRTRPPRLRPCPATASTWASPTGASAR
jgi:glucose dehydrogenase